MSQESRDTADDSATAVPDDDATGETSGVDNKRRRLLASGAATWATVALAGCPSGENGATTTEESTTTEETTTTTDEPTTTPAAQPENFVVTSQTGAGGSGVPAAVSFMSACAATNVFVPGMQVVFYVGIFDPETGDRLTDDDLDSVSVNVGDGMQTIDLSWSSEYSYATIGDSEDWVGSWQVPEDMEPATLSYTVEVSSDSGNFQNVGILQNSIDIVEYDDPTNYVVDTDTFWNGGPDDLPGYTNGFVGQCAPEREFTPEMDVTFVIGIYDSTSGNFVGTGGLHNPNTGETVEDEGSEASGLDSVTVVSTDGSFDDVSLSFASGADEEGASPQWSGTLETENLSPGTYGYEVQISDESEDRFRTGIAAAQFSIIEVPSSSN